MKKNKKASGWIALRPVVWLAAVLVSAVGPPGALFVALPVAVIYTIACVFIEVADKENVAETLVSYLKKYSPIGELGQFAGEYAESLAQTTGYLVLVTDCDHVIAASGSGKKEFEEKPVSRQLEEAISERKNYQASAGDAEFMKVTLDDAGEYTEQAFSTIICEGDAIGAVIICNKDEKKKMNDTEGKLAAAAASFLGRQMEQ